MATKKKKAATRTKTRAKTSKVVAKRQAKAKPARKAVVKAKAKPAKKVAKPAKAKAAPAKAKPVKAKAAPPKAKAAPAKAKATPRRDATGHLDPTYARELRARSRASRDDSNDDHAFLRGARSADALAEELGEEAVTAMTSGEDQGDRLIDAEVEEERGGPFVKTRGRDEFARGTDKSNPRSATREPFPKT